MISKSYQDVRVGTREEESLETLSEDRERLCRCDLGRKVGTECCDIDSTITTKTMMMPTALIMITTTINHMYAEQEICLGF